MITACTKTYLDELPPELLYSICEYALPQGLVFATQQRQPPWSKHPEWRLCAAEPGHSPRPVYCSKPSSNKNKVCASPCPFHSIAHEMQTALLYVNKTISTEARGKKTAMQRSRTGREC